MMNSKKERARQWVNGNTAAAAAVVCATALIPGAATVALLAQEGVMAHHIGRIYKPDMTKTEGIAIAKHIGLAAIAGKIAAMEAAILLGPFSFAAKPAIAAAAVKAIGELLIKYFEENHN